MKPRILLVEDTPLNTDLVIQLLEDDYQVAHVGDGERAIAAALGESFDLILLDLSIPKVDGFEVARRLSETEGFAVPIIALTAHAMVGDRERALAAGCSGYVTKPIDESELFSAIESALCAGRGAGPRE